MDRVQAEEIKFSLSQDAEKLEFSLRHNAELLQFRLRLQTQRDVLQEWHAIEEKELGKRGLSVLVSERLLKPAFQTSRLA
jgi:hypothetical protein